MTELYLGLALLMVIALAFILFPFVKNATVWILPRWFAVALLFLFLPFFSLSLYNHWGASHQIAMLIEHQQREEIIQRELAKFKSVDDVIKKMESHLEKHPDSAQGWFLLGRLYYTTHHFSQAVDVFKKANQIKPNDINYLFNLALALAARDKHVSSECKDVLKQVLVLNPQHKQALELLQRFKNG